MAYPQEDLISMIKEHCDKEKINYCSSLSEADHQLVELHQSKIIQHILTVYGDLYVSGGYSVVSEVSFISGACCIYIRDDIQKRNSMGGDLAKRIFHYCCAYLLMIILIG